MAIVNIIEENEASPEVSALYNEIKQYLNLESVPAVAKAVASDPQNLRNLLETAKRSEATWGREMSHVIGLATATAMSSRYAIDLHCAVLKRHGYDDAKILALLQEISAHISGDSLMTGLLLEPDLTQTVTRKAA